MVSEEKSAVDAAAEKVKSFCATELLDILRETIDITRADGKPSELMKLSELLAKLGGVMGQEKADPYAHLPMLNISIEGGINTSYEKSSRAERSIPLVEVVSGDEPDGDTGAEVLDNAAEQPAEEQPTEASLAPSEEDVFAAVDTDIDLDSLLGSDEPGGGT